MKKLILLSLLAFAACKKDEAKPTPISIHNMDVDGMSYSGMLKIDTKNYQGTGDFGTFKVSTGQRVSYYDTTNLAKDFTIMIDSVVIFNYVGTGKIDYKYIVQ